jgi:hypothetical protein
MLLQMFIGLGQDIIRASPPWWFFAMLAQRIFAVNYVAYFYS